MQFPIFDFGLAHYLKEITEIKALSKKNGGRAFNCEKEVHTHNLLYQMRQLKESNKGIAAEYAIEFTGCIYISGLLAEKSLFECILTNCDNQEKYKHVPFLSVLHIWLGQSCCC